MDFDKSGNRKGNKDNKGYIIGYDHGRKEAGTGKETGQLPHRDFSVKKMKAESPGNAPFSDFRRNGHETEQDAQQIPVYAFPKKGRGERHKKPGGQSQKGGQQQIGVFFYHEKPPQE